MSFGRQKSVPKFLVFMKSAENCQVNLTGLGVVHVEDIHDPSEQPRFVKV